MNWRMFSIGIGVILAIAVVTAGFVWQIARLANQINDDLLAIEADFEAINQSLVQRNRDIEALIIEIERVSDGVRNRQAGGGE